MNWKAPWILLFLVVTPVATAQAAPPNPGDLIFSELFIAPPGSKTTYEYAELFSLASTPVSVDGCYLVLSASSSSCDTATLGVDVEGGCRPITASSDIEAGSYGLLIRDEDKWGPDGCDKTWVGTYATISMSNTHPETISLYCPPSGGGTPYQEVASFTYDWANTPDHETGYSYQLREDYHDLEDATDPRHWCVAPEDAWMCSFDDNGTTRDMYGTPGEPSICEDEVRHPAPGEVAINEINAWPSSSSILGPDWIELWVISAVTEEPLYNLKGCQIGTLKCDTSDPDGCLNMTVDKYSSSDTFDTLFTLTTNQLVVVSHGDDPACLEVNTDPTDGVADGTCERQADLSFDVSLSFDSYLRRIDLNCPDDDTLQMRTVDSVVYQKKNWDNVCCQPDGHCSLELRTERTGENPDDPTLANDDLDNWGAAPATEAYSSGLDTSDGTPEPEENYASPGDQNGVAPAPDLKLPGPGDVVLSEIAPWPSTNTSSPDWGEFMIVGDPGPSRFDLSSCVMRTFKCDDQGLDPQACLDVSLQDTDWSASDTIEAIECQEESPLWGTQGQFILVGNSSTKTCAKTDDAGSCTQFVAAQVSSTVVLGSGTRLLELACPPTPDSTDLITIDRIVYNADWIDPTCALESGHCSWALRPDALSSENAAAANDDPRAWTTEVSPYLDPDGQTALGTPGEPNTVTSSVATSGPPGPGDAFINEMMVDYGTTPEWIEVQARDDGSLYELSGCYLLLDRADSTEDTEGETEDSGLTCNPDTPEECYKSYQIPPEVSFPIGGDGSMRRRVLAKGICLSYGEPIDATPTPGTGGSAEATCQLAADLNVGSALDFSSSTRETLSLWCPTDDGSDYQLIDQFQYDWSDWNDLCEGSDGEDITACSLAVHQDHANAEDNDCDFYRCVGSSGDGRYYDIKGNLCAGTPGEENSCPPIPYTPRGPEAGADARVIVIDEVSMLPEGDNPEVGRFSNEWFEIYNPGQEDLDLASCRFVIGSELDDDGFIVDPGSSDIIANKMVTIKAGQYQLWAPDGCLMGTYTNASGTTPTPAGVEETATPTSGDVVPKPAFQDVSCDVSADVAYDRLSFPNTSANYFQLICEVGCDQEEVIDTVYLDPDGQGIESGHSWELDPAYLDVEANDDPSHWCQASYQQVFGYEDLGKNYGTPGEANACIPPPECGDVVVGCRCDYGGNPGFSHYLATLFLSGFALLGVRFRARSRR